MYYVTRDGSKLYHLDGAPDPSGALATDEPECAVASALLGLALHRIGLSDLRRLSGS